MQTKRVKRKAPPNRPRRAPEEGSDNEVEAVENETVNNPETAEVDHEMSAAAPATAAAAFGAREGPGMSETSRDLDRMNKELQVRVRELELELAHDTEGDESAAAEHTDVSAETGSIIAIIKDLHGELDAAHELKEALEADLAAIKSKLSDEESVRAELKARIQLLEAKAALGDQLREDISFVEEERNETARRLEEATAQLEQATSERDSLAQEKVADTARIQEIQNDRIALEARVLNLEETVAEMDRVRQELAEVREESQRLEENAQSIKGKLEATDVAKNALELDLTTTRELVRHQNEQNDELKDNLTAAHAELAELRTGLGKQEIENVNLQEANKRGEREIKTLTARVESVKKELDSSKKALRDIRAAAVRTTGRVRERYS